MLHFLLTKFNAEFQALHRLFCPLSICPQEMLQKNCSQKHMERNFAEEKDELLTLNFGL